MKNGFLRGWQRFLENRDKRQQARRDNRRHQHLSHKSEGILNWLDYKRPWFRVLYVGIIVVLVLFSLFALLPALWLFVSSFKTTAELYQVPYVFWPENFRIAKIWEVWQSQNFIKYFANSGIVVVGAVLCSVIFNGILAYAIAVIKPKGHKLVFGAIMLSYMIPAAMSIVPLYREIVAFGLIDSYIPLWFVFGANAFYFMNFKIYFESIPKPLFEAARLDGANDLQIFRMIVAPLSRPIIGVVAIFTATAAWSDFLLPLLVLDNGDLQTVMVKIYSIQSTIATNPDFGPDKLLMLLTLSIIPQILIFALFQKQITNTSLSSGIKE